MCSLSFHSTPVRKAPTMAASQHPVKPSSMRKHIWHPLPGHDDIRVGQYIVPNFVSNSVAIKVDASDYVIISPGEPLINSWPDEWPHENATMHLVMPNGFHYMGVNAWQQAFPQHRLYAARGAIKRLIKQGVAAPGDIHALEDTPPPLSDDYHFLFPPGHRAHDTWLRKYNRREGSSLWVTCDSFLNYERLSNQPVAKSLQKLLGAAPGLKMSQVVKWFILNDRKRFKRWALEQIKQDRPVTLIPSHGEVLSDIQLGAQLSSIIQQRL